MTDQGYIAKIEAILFASGEPVEVERLSAACLLPEAEIERLCGLLSQRLDEGESGLMLLRLNGRYQLTTRPEHADAVLEALQAKRNQPLTQAALEVLAILAYHQPVSKGYIEEVRGVDSGSTVNTLVAKGLVEEAGRLDLPGRPIVYRTTDTFLRVFGLSSLDNLPPLTDLAPQEQLTLDAQPE